MRLLTNQGKPLIDQGQTGPLVYPAGFLYIFTGLYYLTDQGDNIVRAQYIFYVLYLVQTYIVMKVYQEALVVSHKKWIIIPLALSR